MKKRRKNTTNNKTICFESSEMNACVLPLRYYVFTSLSFSLSLSILFQRKWNMFLNVLFVREWNDSPSIRLFCLEISWLTIRTTIVLLDFRWRLERLEYIDEHLSQSCNIRFTDKKRKPRHKPNIFVSFSMKEMKWKQQQQEQQQNKKT